MSNILDTIQVSGASYDLKDKNAPSVSSLTQSEYDNLPSTAKTSNTFFVITDAQGGDLSNYWTTAQTQSAITQATSGLQETLVSGTNIKTINNTSILGSGNIDIQGGGGKAIEAGRGITITTGATADTVSFNLPISAGTGTDSIKENYNSNVASGNYSHAEGYGTNALGVSSHAEGSNTAAVGDYSFAGGRNSSANTTYSFAHGRYIKANNESEHSIGKFNVSNTGSTDALKTLFSVGNGSSANARHNAFEIRQNGDIYLSSGGTDIKLQDHLGGGGGGSITIDPSFDASSTNPVANSAITRSLTNGSGAVSNTGGKYKWRFYSVGGYGTNQGFYLDTINGEPVVRKYDDTRSLQLVETSAITTTITSSSTDAQVPSAKAVYDIVGDIETLLSQI